MHSELLYDSEKLLFPNILICFKKFLFTLTIVQNIISFNFLSITILDSLAEISDLITMGKSRREHPKLRAIPILYTFFTVFSESNYSYYLPTPGDDPY